MLRIVSWIVVVCTLASALGVFLPAVGLRVPGPLAKRTSLSLYHATTDRDFVRKVLVGYNRSAGKRIGGAVVAMLSPHAGARTKEYVDDVHDAMDTVNGISDDDAKSLGRALVIAVWTFLLLHVMMGGLVLRETVNGNYRRSRLVVAAVVAVVVAAAAIAIHLGCREAVWQANDELGHDPLVLAGGAYVIPFAAVVAFVTSIVLVIVARPRR